MIYIIYRSCIHTDRNLPQLVASLRHVSEVSQSVSLVLSKLRMRYKGDHKCRRAANTGLTLLSLYLVVLQITRTFLSTSWGCHLYTVSSELTTCYAWSDVYIQLFNF